jgi:hypothetical protein
MAWLRRIGRSPPAEAQEEPAESTSEAVEGSTPGVTALLDGMEEDGSHSVLDLGPAAPSSLRIYGRYAHRVRFADLLAIREAEGWDGALRSIPPQGDRPYDLILAWDILDWLEHEERQGLIHRLAELTRPGARLHVLVRAGDELPIRPLRFSLLDVGRMRYEPVGPPEQPHPRILPAELERLVRPFEVVRAFTLKGDLREYVARRREG